MPSVRTHGDHRNVHGTDAERRPRRRVTGLLRGGAAGIAGVLLAATPTWGAGMDSAAGRPAGKGEVREAAGPERARDQPWIPEPERAAAADRQSDRAPDTEAAPAGQEGAPGSWTLPVPASKVSATYGIPGSWIAGHHTGIDFAVPVGTPVRSIGAGEVVQTGAGGDYGQIVMVRMNDGRYTLFAHLSKIVVKEGQKVGPDKLLGYSGNTGRSSGPHLHFEVRTSAKYGSDINPVTYLASKGVTV